MNYRLFNKKSGLLAATIMGLAIMSAPQESQATTFANTTVSNTVRVDYQSLGGAAYNATASVTVTVNLVPVAPTVAFVSQSPVATLATPTDELTTVTQTYSIVANANGAINYTINQAGYTPTNLSAATAVSSSSTLWLGATSLGVQADGTNIIYVPLDTCVNGTGACTYTAANNQIGGDNGLVANDFVMIGGTKYTVSAIDNSATAAALLPLDQQGKFAKLTLSANVPNTVLPGTQIGEYQEFTKALTTGSLTGTNTSGDYAGSITATDGSNTSAAATSTVYVARCDLSIIKEVFDGTNWVASATMAPNQDLHYRIIVTNNSAKKSCKSISIFDNMSPYVAFKLSSLAFTDGPSITPLPASILVQPVASGLTFPATTTTTYLDQAEASYTPVSAGGGAAAGYDLKVHQWKIDFTTQQMAPSSGFVIDYYTKLL